MPILVSLVEAQAALVNRRGRAALAVLMTAIGVAAVIVLMGVLGGAQREVARRIQALGSNIVSVSPGVTSAGGARLGIGMRPSLTQDDVDAIRAEVPGVIGVSGTWWSGGQAVVGARNWTTRIHGVNPDFFVVRNWNLLSGRFFDAVDQDSYAKVAMIGAIVAEKLFGNEDPVGREIRLRNVPFRVAGVLEPKGQSFAGTEQDDIILIPMTTARLRLNFMMGPEFKRVSAISGRDRFRNPGEADPYVRRQQSATNPAAFYARMVHVITARFADGADMAASERAIAEVLRKRRPETGESGDDFRVGGFVELWKAQTETTRSLALLVTIAGALAIVTSGAGIMNTMLIAVSERIPEIGVRLAVGARRSDILGQFLFEAAMIAGIGALVGVISGVAAVWAIGAAGLAAPVVTASWVASIAAIAVITGLFFGFYPAWRAARLDPVTCLRTT
jgi:putative ABC transport system permease protein